MVHKGNKDGTYREQRWYIQGTKMVHTGNKDGTHREQRWYIKGTKMVHTGNKDEDKLRHKVAIHWDRRDQR